MTSRNVELHRRLIEMFNANDLEAWIALADPRIEWHSRFATVGAVTVYRGHEGLRRYASDMDDVWGGEARVEVEAYFDLGEQTLAFYTLRARGKHSGAETSMWFAHVARWHDGRYFYGKAYVDREEALAELGISEHSCSPSRRERSRRGARPQERRSELAGERRVREARDSIRARNPRQRGSRAHDPASHC